LPAPIAVTVVSSRRRTIEAGLTLKLVQLKKKHYWLAIVGAGALAYLAFVATALHDSIAQLHVGRHYAATARPGPEARVTLLRAPKSSTQSARDDAVPVAHEPSARHPSATTGEPRVPPTPRATPESLAPNGALAPPDGDAPEEDASLLHQQALLDLAARRDFAELLNDPDPNVRQAMRDFVEER
jgi:hypothetical protein